MELIDSHAHIDGPQFADDREAMLSRAQAAGVSTILAIGTGPGPEKLDAALPYAEALDYFYDHSPREVQERVFREQMELAHAAKLPVIIHCRDAWDDCLRILEEVWKPTGLGGILHCFTSTLDHAQKGLDMGFLVSFTGNISYPKAQNIRDVAKALPLSNILIETDSPYLAPQPYRGKRNEPAYVLEVAKALANVRDLELPEIAAQTTGNFRRFFRLTRPDASTAELSR